MPGVVVGILSNGVERTAAFGVTSVNNPLPVDENTLFQVGSITKTFTATLAMRLVDEGQLELDQPLRTYLPDLRLADPNAAATVTARHLLTHTAGWVGDFFADTGRGDDALERYVAQLVELEQLTPPGAIYSYNNAGFSLLGRLIEVLIGEPFESALKRLVLAPLGLERSFLFPEEVMTDRYAVGHVVPREGQTRVLEPWHLPRAITPASGLITSVKDQLRYARFQMGDGRGATGERVLTSASHKAMHQPLVPSTGLPDRRVGLAWNIGTSDVSHGGGTHGQISFLMVCRKHGAALSVLTNAGSGAEVADAAIRWVLERWVGERQPTTPITSATREVLDGCAGLYRAPLDDVEIGRKGMALIAREIVHGGYPTRDTPAPQLSESTSALMRLGFYAKDRLVGLESPYLETRAELIRGPAGDGNGCASEVVSTDALEVNKMEDLPALSVRPN